MVISLIMVAVTTVFGPMLNAFRRNNRLAEANPMMDNIAMLMLDDLTGANSISNDGDADTGDVLTITHTAYTVHYRLYNGEIQRNIPESDLPGFRPLFDVGFYRGNDINFEWETDGEYFTLTLTLTSSFDNWTRTREYTVRVVGLVP